MHEKTSAPNRRRYPVDFQARHHREATQDCGDPARVSNHHDPFDTCTPICVPCVMHRRGERAGDRTQTSSILYTKTRRLSTPNFLLSKGLWDSWRGITSSPVPHNRSHKSPTIPLPERSPAKNHPILRRFPRRESREELRPDSPRHPAMLVSSMRLASHSMSGSSPPPRSASGRTTK